MVLHVRHHALCNVFALLCPGLHCTRFQTIKVKLSERGEEEKTQKRERRTIRFFFSSKSFVRIFNVYTKFFIFHFFATATRKFTQKNADYKVYYYKVSPWDHIHPWKVESTWCGLMDDFRRRIFWGTGQRFSVSTEWISMKMFMHYICLPHVLPYYLKIFSVYIMKLFILLTWMKERIIFHSFWCTQFICYIS